MFDVENEKVPEGYVKVNETIQGSEGRQVIHTVYEKKDNEGKINKSKKVKLWREKITRKTLI